MSGNMHYFLKDFEKFCCNGLVNPVPRSGHSVVQGMKVAIPRHAVAQPAEKAPWAGLQ